ncbi:MAG: hypothetical protein CMJ65_03090 [Planctomycetaceae bacterium]|nr:hypothetical protein [Planctomycetaceae bacterium]
MPRIDVIGQVPGRGLQSSITHRLVDGSAIIEIIVSEGSSWSSMVDRRYNRDDCCRWESGWSDCAGGNVPDGDPIYSHSIVLGGFELMS